ncbi:MAG: hypothetical protein ACI9MF_001668 [Gammaproteobacteria bacterium]
MRLNQLFNWICILSSVNAASMQHYSAKNLRE